MRITLIDSGGAERVIEHDDLEVLPKFIFDLRQQRFYQFMGGSFGAEEEDVIRYIETTGLVI